MSTSVWGYASPPEGASLPSGDAKLGAEIERFLYRSPEGDVAVVVDYFNAPADAPSATEDGLVCRYATYDPDRGGWHRSRAVPKSIFLYRLNDLVERPDDRKVLICATEREADHLQALDAGGLYYIATTWLGPEMCAKACDYRPLEGREVILCPEYSDGGLRAMGTVAGILSDRGIPASIIDPRAINVRPGWTLRSVKSILELDALVKHAKGITKAPRSMMQAPAPAAGTKLGLVSAWAEWGFQTNDRGKPYENINNVQKFLQAQPEHYGDVWMDTYRRQIRRGSIESSVEWTDADDIRLQVTVQAEAGLGNIGKITCHDAVVYHAMMHPRNPYYEYRELLKWDGVPRVDSAFTRGWGTPDDEYHRAASRIFFIQQARRILENGCKADLMFIFEGTTGSGKSSALQVVFGATNVVVPTCRFGQKDFYQQILGKAVVEIADLSNFKGASLEEIKNDVSRQTDRFRPPYGRVPEDFDRQCVFVGTTESCDWNQDQNLTARRFPPVECGKIDLEWLRENAEQLLAEAWHRAKSGEPADDRQLPMDVWKEKQLARVEADPFDDPIRCYLESATRTTTLDVARMVIGEELRDVDTAAARRIAKILRKYGWVQLRSGFQRYWKRSDALQKPDEF